VGSAEEGDGGSVRRYNDRIDEISVVEAKEVLSTTSTIVEKTLVLAHKKMIDAKNNFQKF